MAVSRRVNEAVELFRETEWLQVKADMVTDRMQQKINAMSVGEVEDFVRLTNEISQVTAEAVSTADDQHYAETTKKQYVRRAMLNAGMDK